MLKKYIKLINSERINLKVTSAKAAESKCESGSYDYCTAIDNAQCSNFAYDECVKDYSACYNGADDICTNVDSDSPCNGAGGEDYIK